MCEPKDRSTTKRLGDGNYMVERVCQKPNCPHPTIVGIGPNVHKATVQYGERFKAHNIRYHKG